MASQRPAAGAGRPASRSGPGTAPPAARSAAASPAAPAPARLPAVRSLRPLGRRRKDGGGGTAARPPPPRLPELRQVPRAAAAADRDLRDVLELARDEELEELYGILFVQPSPLSPVLKSAASAGRQGAARFHAAPRAEQERVLAERFLFLAAGSVATLRGERPSYRGALEALASRLQLDRPGLRPLLTCEVEMEVFCKLLETFRDASPPPGGREGLELGDGMAVGPLNRVDAPLRFGGDGLARSALKGAAAAAVHLAAAAVHGGAAGAVTGRSAALLGQKLRLGVVAEVVSRESVKRVALSTSVEAAALGAGVLRGACSALGSVMLVHFLADICLQSVGTDHARVARAVFTLAQIRLVRTAGLAAAGDGAEQRFLPVTVGQGPRGTTQV